MHYSYILFFSALFQTNAMQMNLKDEARDFNKNLGQVQKNGLKTKKKRKIYHHVLDEFHLVYYNIYIYIYIYIYI